VLNARIRKAWLHGAQVSVVGQAVDLTYDYTHAGTDRAALDAVLKQDHDKVLDAPSVVIVGQAALLGADGEAVLAAAMELATRTQSGLLVLHTAAARVGAMDVGCTTEGGVAAVLNGADVVLNLGADEVDIPAGPLVIYQGSHGDRGAHRADIILPAAAWTEEPGLFVNTEGRPQLALRTGFAPGEAKENWAILRALSGEIGAVLPFDSQGQLRAALYDAVPHLAATDEVLENDWHPLPFDPMGTGDFGVAVTDFYLTNAIARASALMAELSAGAKARRDAAPLAAE
jgi:NADH-quinone oxidoreductase subunit G